MTKFIKKLLKINGKETDEKTVKEQVSDSREELKMKVEEGTKRAVKEYKEVFEKLAEYDRT
ncbi:MAG: hypothetical protein WAP55_00610 [Minisyncoccia bacterium]